jgi:hypothetical protein
METITNVEKAREIAKKLSNPNIDDFGDGDDEFDTRFYHTNKDAALEAMQWKQQQIIEGTCDTIKRLLGGYVIQNFNFGDSYDTDRFIEDLIKELNKE